MFRFWHVEIMWVLKCTSYNLNVEEHVNRVPYRCLAFHPSQLPHTWQSFLIAQRFLQDSFLKSPLYISSLIIPF